MKNQNSPKINPSKLLSNSSFQGKGKNSGVYILKNDLVKIKKKVLKIEKLITNINFLKGKTSEISKKYKEQEKFKKREKDLEKKEESKEGGKIKLPEAPKLGFLDRIKNFITSILFGYIAIKLIDHLPKLIEVAKFIGSAFEFFADISGKLLNGLATFVQKGYEAYDFTRKTLKSFGGDQALKLFDGFNNAVGNVITAAIAASFALADMVGGDDGGGGSGGKAKRGFDNKGRRVGKNAQKRFAQRYGKSEFIRRFGKDNLKNLPKSIQRGALQKGARNAFVGLAGKGGAKAVLKFTKPFLNKLPIIGGLIDFGLSVALGEDPGRAAFKAIGAALLGSVGAAIGSVVPVAGTIIGGVAGGFLGDAAGGALYDYFFKNKKPKGNKQDVVKAAGGGQTPMTRAGKITGAPPKRTPKRIKTKRQIAIQPTPLKPGANVGGEYALEKVFPRGVFEDETSPLDYIEQTYKKTGKDNFFGPILNLQTKSIVGQKPSKVDYRNAAQGLVNWMNITFSGEILRTGALHAAGGGQIDSELLANKSGDMVNVIANSIENLVSKRVTETVRDLMGQLDIDVIEGGGTGNSGTPETSGTTGSSGSFGSSVFGDAIDKKVLDFIADGEASQSDPYGGFNASRGKTSGRAVDKTIGWLVQNAQGAIGRYQHMPTYLMDRAISAGYNANTIFTPEVQDKITLKFLEGAPHYYREWKSGKLSDEDFLSNLAPTWRAIPQGPKNAARLGGSPNSTYNDSHASGNGAKGTWEQRLNALKAIKSSSSQTTQQPQQSQQLNPTQQSQQSQQLQQSQTDYFYGDSIAVGYGKNNPGKRVVGVAPSTVLSYLQNDLKDNKEKFRGKTVYLSTGVSNNRSDFGSIERQLSLLKQSGAITKVIGAAKGKYDEENEKLSSLASKYGATFLGGFTPGADGIHPKSYDINSLDPTASSSSTSASPTSTSTPSTPSTPTRRKRTRRSSRRRRNRRQQQSANNSNTYSTAATAATAANLQQGNSNFIQGNSGASGGVHFHIGPGTQPGVVDTKYNADARLAAQNVVKHFLGKTTVFDGRRNTNYTSGSDAEILAAQEAHSRGGSQGGVDIQVGGANPRNNKIPFPFAVSNMAERPGGFGVSAMIKGLNAFVAHGRYNERGELAQQLGTRSSAPFTAAEGYAFHGKFISKDGNYFLHRGEFVVDKDSVDIFGKDFISTINEIENKTELKQKVGSLIEHLKYIADYEPGAEQEVEVEIPEPEVVYMQTPVPIPMGGSVAGSSSGSSSNYTDMLYEHA